VRLDRLFFLYMAGVGAALGALLVVEPAAGDFVIKPYFWMVIAVVVLISSVTCVGAAFPDRCSPWRVD
jgi:hypothetical protein